jgi:hypothetical protein
MALLRRATLVGGGSLNRLGDWVNRRYLKFRKNYQLSA